MPKLVLILLKTSLLISWCNLLCAQSNESYDGENQSASAITKNKYQPITRPNVSKGFATVGSRHVISESKDLNQLHSIVGLAQPHAAAVNVQSDINLQDEANTGALVGPDEKVDEIKVHTPMSNTRNSFPKELFPTTSIEIRNIHDNMKPPIDDDRSNAYNQVMVSAEEKTTDDSIGDADHVHQGSTKKYYKYIRKGTKNHTIENLPSAASVTSDQDVSSKHINYFHLFMNLYDHHMWDLTSIKHELSYDCAVDMGIYLSHLAASHLWAMKVCDASGRYGGQSFFGNDFWLGSKSFCEEINRLYKNDNETSFVEMTFFVATIKVKLAEFVPDVKPMQLGQCLPKSCSIRDIYHILREDPISKKMLDSNTCQTMNSTHLNSPSCILLDVTNLRLVPGSYSLLNDNRFYLLSLTLIVLITTVIFATYYENFIGGTIADAKNNSRSKHTSKSEDVKLSGMEKLVESDAKALELNHLSQNNNIDDGPDKEATTTAHSTKVGKHLGLISEILLCFAAGSNSKTILSVETANKDSLTCIHGLRLYSLLWTIMVHTYLQLFAVGENRVARKITERSFSYQVVGNATFSVDTFFFISGVLIVVLYFRSAKNEPSNEKHTTHLFNSTACSNIFLSILYRFIRLTPAYLFVIIFNELALKWTYGRSVFTPGIIDHITCNKYWWRNILYINNWYSFSEMCMIWSWYLANDMQFYVVAIIILTVSSRYMKTSAFILGLLMVCSWAMSIFLSIHFNYTYKVAEPFESFDVLYDKPWQRITPYIIGMLTGYILHFKKTPPKVPMLINILLWACSLLILFVLVFGVWDGVLSVPMTALYVSLGHTAWGVALIWITLSCCWGYATPINNILSYQAIFPLSRLSYCAYLLHPVVMMATSFQMEAPMHLQHVIVVTMFFGNAVLSFILAYFVSLIFEAPVVKLLKLAFRR